MGAAAQAHEQVGQGEGRVARRLRSHSAVPLASEGGRCSLQCGASAVTSHRLFVGSAYEQIGATWGGCETLEETDLWPV